MKNNEIRNILHNASKSLEKELRKNAKPSELTGALDKSFKSKGYEINGDFYTIKVEAMYYAKYVDGGKNKQRAKDFITKSITNVIDDNTDNIIKHQYDQMEKLFYTSSPSTNYPSRTKKYI